MQVGQAGDGQVAVAPAAAAEEVARSAAPSPAVPREPARPARSWAKRAIDLALGGLVLVPVVVLGVVLALLVAVSSRGPVFFAQDRIGLGGRRFRMFKFRTMHLDAERRLQQDPRLWAEYVQNDFKLPPELDARVTRVGRFLRRSSLDELPQVLNVLLGTMTLVGPRPVVPEELANYGDHQDAYLSVKPGLTGLWQVSGRSDIAYPERIDLDRTYVETWSLWLDARILLRTPLAVLTARGAF